MSAPLQRLRTQYAACIQMGLVPEADALARLLDLGEAEVAAHRGGVQYWDDDVPPGDFDEFARIGPGRFDPRVLGQTTWWVDILRRPHRISDVHDFTDDHLAAVIRFLGENAWRWSGHMALPAHPAAPDAPGHATQWTLAHLVEGLEATPLMRTLRAEATRRGLTL